MGLEKLCSFSTKSQSTIQISPEEIVQESSQEIDDEVSSSSENDFKEIPAETT